jgi:RNA polymerase sigma factor (sigma-70 family)
MAETPLQTIVQKVRHLAAAHHAKGLTDADLLRAFLATDDQPAFAELMRRHAPMVLSVCRRVLHHAQDAEDAFQATFILLAQRAGSLRKADALASWLHGVAHHMATKAQRAAFRRRTHENRSTPAPPPDPAWSAAWREVQAILDEEIERLPEIYRQPFILCCLENRSCAEVARQLGHREGTVWSRLARARQKLQASLSKRGVSLAAGGLAAALKTAAAPAAVPPALAAATLRASILLSAGAAPAGIFAPKAVLLAEAALKGIFLMKLKQTVAVILVVGALGAAGVHWGTGLSASPAASETGVATTKSTPAAVRKAEGTAPSVAEPGRHATPARAEAKPPGGPQPRARPAKGEAPKAKEGREPADSEATPAAIRLQHSSSVTSLAFTPNGKSLVTGCADRFLRVWDLANGKESLRVEGGRDGVIAVAVSQNGSRFVSASKGDGTLRMIDAASGKQFWQSRTRGDVKAIALSLDEKVLISGDESGGVYVWHAPTGMETRLFKGHTAGITSVAITPDNKLIVSAGKDGIICLWEAETGKLLARLAAGNEAIETVALAPDGKTLAFAGKDKMVHVWDIAANKEQHQLAGHLERVRTLAFTPDGRMLLSGGDDRALILWDPAEGRKARRAVRHRGPVQAVVFSPDGKYVASAGDEGLAIVSTLAGLRAAQLKPVDLSADQLKALWDDLKRDDPKGFEATDTLIAGAKHAVPFLGETVKPAGPPKVPEKLAQWIKDLDSDEFAVRQKATEELQKAGKLAEKPLRDALRGTPSLEARTRMTQLLEKLGGRTPPTPDERRSARVIDVLEEIATPEARAVLEKLAQGDARAEQTQLAKAALDRLSKRSEKPR